METDYLVVGAGAAGMAFCDVLLEQTEAEILLVDRRHAPGGHWLDAYPFVRLHQPSSYYGLPSRVLGEDHLDEVGPNAGSYERATAPEICAYYQRHMDDTFAPSGRVTFLGVTEYRGQQADGHLLVSLLSGEETLVTVRRRLVDATLLESDIPLRHTLPFPVDEDVRIVPPNDLVHLGDARAFTVIGAGKTALDVCGWLLDQGVDPDRIRWIKTRESWLFDRAWMQPLTLVASLVRMNTNWLEAAGTATHSGGFALDLEERGVFVRVDRDVVPGIFRGATISRNEVDTLRTLTRVVRHGRVTGIRSTGLAFADAELPSEKSEVYIDCTARGLPVTPERPVFDIGRVSIQYCTFGINPWSAATIAAIESLDLEDEQKNRLAIPFTYTGDAADLLPQAYTMLSNVLARSRQPELMAWDATCRLNPFRGVADRGDDPEVATALGAMLTAVGPAIRNLRQFVAS